MKPRRKFAALKGNKIFPIGEQKKWGKGLTSPTLSCHGEDEEACGMVGE